MKAALGIVVMVVELNGLPLCQPGVAGAPKPKAAQAQQRPSANLETTIFQGEIGEYGLLMGSEVYFKMDVDGKTTSFLLDEATAQKYKIIRQAPDGVGYSTPDFHAKWGGGKRLKVTCEKQASAIGNNDYFRVVRLEVVQPVPPKKYDQ